MALLDSRLTTHGSRLHGAEKLRRSGEETAHQPDSSQLVGGGTGAVGCE